jgi:hypothetical protein
MVIITFAVHIPLNEDLKDAGDPAQIENISAVRDDFVTPWVAWDIVRLLVTTAAFGFLTWALILRTHQASLPGGTRHPPAGRFRERRPGLGSAA